MVDQRGELGGGVRRSERWTATDIDKSVVNSGGSVVFTR